MAREQSASPADSYVSDTLQNLVNQFSQELCFYRELVQNAIDAGSSRVDVEVENRPAEGVAVARVIDYGEGMDRRIIDTQLTRLFSSSKEDDLTKIGKFGIGFVSVFSVKPVAVVVDTGKSGEHWRVLFKPDGTFERISLDEPVEGTRVEVYLPTRLGGFNDFLRRSEETVRYWCRHAEAEVFFEGKPINEAFDLDAQVKVTREVQGTTVVAAISNEENPFFGFYNQGITLLEGETPHFNGVAFKIKSRYLEHTLSRDNVKQDPQYEKAMAIVADVIRTDLVPALLDALARAADTPALPSLYKAGRRLLTQHWGSLGRKARFIPRHSEPPASLADLEEIARRTSRLLKSIGFSESFKQEPGWPVSAIELLSLDKNRVLLAETHPSPVSQALTGEGISTLAIESVSAMARDLVTFHRFNVRPTNQIAALQPVATDVLPPPLEALGTTALALLTESGVDVASCSFGHFCYPGSPLASHPYVLQPKPHPLTVPKLQPVLDEDAPPPTWAERTVRKVTGLGLHHLVINLDHPIILRLKRLAEVDTRTAGFLLAKLVCLADGLHPEMNARLLQHALEGDHGAR